VNTVILIYYTFESDQDKLDVLDSIDNYLVYFYAAEVVIKLFGMGVANYFDNIWNIMDFALTIVSFATNVALSFFKFARTAKAGRLVRIARVLDPFYFD
jgi:hypothetical protein